MLLSLDLGSSYMSTYICKIHPAVHLRFVHFAVYMLYINKKMFLRKTNILKLKTITLQANIYMAMVINIPFYYVRFAYLYFALFWDLREYMYV